MNSVDEINDGSSFSPLLVETEAALTPALPLPRSQTVDTAITTAATTATMTSSTSTRTLSSSESSQSPTWSSSSLSSPTDGIWRRRSSSWSSATTTISSASLVDPFNLFSFFPTRTHWEGGEKEWDWLSGDECEKSAALAAITNSKDETSSWDGYVEYYGRNANQNQNQLIENTTRGLAVVVGVGDGEGYCVTDRDMDRDDKDAYGRRRGDFGHTEMIDVAEKMIDEEDKIGVLRLTSGKITRTWLRRLMSFKQ